MNRRLAGLATLALVAAVAVTVFVWPRRHDVANLPQRVATRFVPPSSGQEVRLRRPERLALEGLASRLHGKLVWSSNRSGNHELYVIELPGLQVRQLTDHPHVDFYSRFSPDGEWVLFNRSQREWVSFREDDAWDVYRIRIDGSDEQLVVRNGYHANWTADGRGVVFLRAGKVLRVDLTSGAEEVLFVGAERLEGRDFGDPELHPDGSRIAVGVVQFGAAVGALGDGPMLRLTEGQVCQTTWVPATDDLLWVEPEGNGGTRIARGAADGSRREVLMDLAGDRSHEYFPKLSQDGRWLTWGATAEGHEHDRADYEIYVWQLGTDWSEAVRITHHTGNDQWPDLWVTGPDEQS